MNLTDYTTEELLGLSAGLREPDPIFLRRPPVSQWAPEVRSEVDRIGQRSLAARDLLRYGKDGTTTEVPELLAMLCSTISQPDLCVQVAHIRSTTAETAMMLVARELTAVHRPGDFGNHNFTLMTTDNASEILAEMIGIEDLTISKEPAIMISRTEFEALMASAAQSGENDDAATVLQRSGLSPTSRESILALAQPGTTSHLVEVLGPDSVERGLIGSITLWLNRGLQQGLWIASQIEDGEPGDFRLAPCARSQVLASIAEGFPDWLPQSGFLSA